MIMDICISEKKLEDYLFNHLNKSKIIESIKDDIPIVLDGCVYRQFSIGGYGIADIVTIDTEDGDLYSKITVYELKQGVIDHSALIQALRYKRGISKFLDDSGYEYVGDPVGCVLIGGGISQTDDFNIAVSALDSVDVYTYGVCPNEGFILESQNWYKETEFPDSFQRAFLGIDYAAHDFEATHYWKTPF